MNVLMMTNTFLPHVGGVARSVQRFTAEYRRQGHRVLVVAPRFEGAPDAEAEVIRVPAIQRFNGSDFSMPLPASARLAAALDAFAPDVIHSHHPFLLGDAAQRVGAARDVPVVFTHHTMYSHYTHYVPGNSPRLRRFVIDLVTGYCNLCEAVVAPSESVAEILRQRGVTSPIEAIPTGVVLEDFAQGDGQALRRRLGVPTEAFVVGNVGRLAPEKNLGLLAAAVADFLERTDDAHFLVAGEGPSSQGLVEIFRGRGLGGRLHMLGTLTTAQLADAYAAMNVFAFASQSETQGMVLTEAMAAQVPVVAVDAPGVRDVVVDGVNGHLVAAELAVELAAALTRIRELDADQIRALRAGAAETAERFSLASTAERALKLYATTISSGAGHRRDIDDSPWAVARRRIAEEWKIWRNVASALGEYLHDPEPGVEESRG